MESRTYGRCVLRSLSARRAWIEIDDMRMAVCAWIVALRKESVDRNILLALLFRLKLTVALRKESVDRNGLSYFYIIKITEVALRKESVDRNFCCEV